MNAVMRARMPSFGHPKRSLSFGLTVLLGAIAGLTIFLGLPIARMRNVSANTVGALNALAIGILVYLVVEIAGNATAPLADALTQWHGGGGSIFDVVTLAAAYAGGFLIGLVGLGTI